MKKIIILLTITLSFYLYADDIKFNYSQNDTRKFPTNQDYILSYSNILDSLRESIVNISIKKNVLQEKTQKSLVSGVLISEDGYIITNSHIITDTDEIIVKIIEDNIKYKAKLIGKDKNSNLVVIKIDKTNLNAITFYNSNKVRLGDVVFALGNPFGLYETITQGIVSAKVQTEVGIVEYENFIQTDASINPGNIGGALINSRGNLIGINTDIISKHDENLGIGFAIPSNMVTTIASQLIESAKYTRSYLGVNISDVSEAMSNFYNNNYGALITSVETDAPAKIAGLKRGDLIVALNDIEIKNTNEFKKKIRTFSPNTEVLIKIFRDKKIETIKIKLGKLNGVSPDGTVSYEGAVIQNIDSSIRAQLKISPNVDGVLITDIESNSAAAKIGILKGDIIIQVENKEIKNLNEFKKALRIKTQKRLYIYRRGGVFAVVL